MLNAPTLPFDLAPIAPLKAPTPKPRPSHPRERQIAAASERVTDRFKDDFRRVLLTVANAQSDFIAEDVTEAYAKRFGAPTLEQKRATGSIFQMALKNGVIVKTNEYRARKQGNMCAVYRRGI